MIIANGTIEIRQKSGGGIDPSTGFPAPLTSVVWSCPIECQYSANKYNMLGRTNGESFTMANYIVLIEDNGFPFEAEQVRIKDRQGKVIGEYSVISIEPLETVGQVRIML